MSMVLVLNLSVSEICLAVDTLADKPDSTSTKADIKPAEGAESGTGHPAPAASDKDQIIDTDLQQGEDQQAENPNVPVYKKRWFWAAVGGVLLVTVIALASGAGGGGEKTRNDLPDFPEPPQR
jgi:hypothetical protein